MKYLVYLLMLSLSGCGSVKTVTDRYFNNSLLDTAPKDHAAVKYPEWGDENYKPEKPQSQTSAAAVAQRKPMRTEQKSVRAVDSLTQFLRSQLIAYQILPGNFSIVRIKRVINFATGSDDVSYQSRAWIYKITDYLSSIKTKDIEVIIDGHADLTGSMQRNDKLSRQRAEAVKALLADAPNVSVDSIYARGYSDVLPACSNISSYGRACNRRVELFFIVRNDS